MTKRRTCSTAIQKRADSYKLQFCSLFSLSSYPRNMEATPWGFPVPIVRAASSVWAHCSGLISRGKCGALQLITYSHSEVTMGSFSEAQPRHGLMNYLPRRHLVNPRSCRGSAFWWERRLIAHPGGQTTTPFPNSNKLEFHYCRLVFRHLCPPSSHSTLCLPTPANDGRPDELIQGLLAVASNIYPSCTKTECDTETEGYNIP